MSFEETIGESRFDYEGALHKNHFFNLFPIHGNLLLALFLNNPLLCWLISKSRSKLGLVVGGFDWIGVEGSSC